MEQALLEVKGLVERVSARLKVQEELNADFSRRVHHLRDTNLEAETRVHTVRERVNDNR